jgi:hypothetical protein
MQFLFNLLSIMSVGCTWCSQLTSNPRNIPSAVCEAPPEVEQVMLEHEEALNS